MKRLTISYKIGGEKHVNFAEGDSSTGKHAAYLKEKEIQLLLDTIANYEDAEQEGKLAIFPIKVGDIVYLPRLDDENNPISAKVIEMGINKDGEFFVVDDDEFTRLHVKEIGEYFLSSKEAKKNFEEKLNSSFESSQI